jgi:hypothetical protein
MRAGTVYSFLSASQTKRHYIDLNQMSRLPILLNARKIEDSILAFTQGFPRGNWAEMGAKLRFSMRKIMIPEIPSLTQLSQVITQVTAPTFLLGAVAAFTSVLIARMNRIIERAQILNAIGDDDSERGHLKSDIPRLKRRAMMLNKAIFFSTISAITTSLLVIVAFVAAYLKLAHEYGVAVLFVLALAFFIAALVNLAGETRIALREMDFYK